MNKLHSAKSKLGLLQSFLLVQWLWDANDCLRIKSTLMGVSKSIKHI